MKKKIISTALAVAAVLSLAGCNSDSGITVNTSSNSSASTGSSANNSSDSSANSTATSSSDASGNSDTSSSNTAASSSAVSSDEDSNTSSDNAPSADNVAAVLNAPLPIVYKDSVPDFSAVDENAPVPTSLEFLKATGTNIDNSDSVIIRGTIEGVAYTWDANYENTTVKQTYTFVATKDATYLRVAHQDDAVTPSTVAYEEYRVLNDNGTYSTITKSSDKWVATPSEYYLLGLSDKRDPNGPRINYDDSKLMFEYNGSNLYENSIRTIGMLRPFASDFITKDRFGEDDMIVGMPIVRDENRNLILKVDDWAGLKSSDKMFETSELTYRSKALSNFFRYSPDELQLLETNNRNISGYTKGTKISHVVSPNYLLETITGHIGNKNGVELDFTLEFSDWNGVAKINVPNYVTE